MLYGCCFHPEETGKLLIWSQADQWYDFIAAEYLGLKGDV